MVHRVLRVYDATALKSYVIAATPFGFPFFEVDEGKLGHAIDVRPRVNVFLFAESRSAHALKQYGGSGFSFVSSRNEAFTELTSGLISYFFF